MSSLIKVVTPVCDIKPTELQDHVVLSGPLLVTDTINVAQSFQLSPASPVSCLFTVNPPSNQTIINRYIRVRSYLEFTATGGAFQLTTNDAVSQFPFSQLVDVLTLTINGESVSENVSDKLSALLCYGNTAQDRVKSWSTSAPMGDSYQSYQDWASSYGGSARNPLAAYGENAAEISRGGFEYQVVSPTVVRVVVTEPLWISPLFQGIGDMQEGMCNVNQLSFNFRFKSDSSRAWSHSNLGNAITAVTCKFYQAPELLVQYQTPALLDRLPAVQQLSYAKCNEYLRQVPTLAAGGSTTVFSDSIRLSQIPRSVYLFCRHSESQSTFEYPNSFLSIENIQVNWCNQSALFSGSTKQDLYEMSVRNGLNLSYPEFSKYRGSVVCIDLGKDLGLLDSESPSVQGSYTLQVQMTVKNQAASDFASTFYMVVVNSGTFSISQNSARASLGNLSPQMVLSAKEMDGMSYADYRELRGGSFWSSLKTLVGKAGRWASKLAPGLATALPQYAPIISGVGNLGSAVADATGQGRLVGGSASRLIGGRRMR
jgi:hypothetical protein